MLAIHTATNGAALITSALLCLGGLITAAFATTTLLALIQARKEKPDTPTPSRPCPGDFLLQIMRFNQVSKG